MLDLPGLLHPPLVWLTGVDQPGHLLAWVRHERDGSWHARVSWVTQQGGKPKRLVVDTQAHGVHPIDADRAYADVPRYQLGRDGKVTRL